MDHQDWNNITLNTKSENEKRERKKRETSQIVNNNVIYKLDTGNNLSKLIIEGRNIKKLKQNDLAKLMNISVSIIQRWETNKEIPSNLQIATMEKILCIKLPRSKKIKIDE